MKTFKRNLLLAIMLTGWVFVFSQCAKETVADGEFYANWVVAKPNDILIWYTLLEKHWWL